MHPYLFSIGKLKIYSYGVMVALGTCLGTFLIYRHALKKKMQAEKIVDLIFWIVLWGLIGGRIFYVLMNPDIYLNNIGEIIKIHKGGLVFHGSLIFALIAAAVFTKRNGLAFLETMDVIMLYLPLAHAIGRLGCFLNGCCFGKPAQAFWGVIFPGHSIPVYPTQIYSSLLLLVIFLILFFLEKGKQFNGQIIFSYLILYGTMRFFIEFLRDNPLVLGSLTMFQCISVVIILTGLLSYSFVQKKNKKVESNKIEKTA